MKKTFQLLIVTALAGVYVATFVALLRPRYTPAYRAYYIDHTSADWNPTRYSGTPEIGIIFGRVGLPQWVDHMTGFSIREDWGRWTDGNVAKAGTVFFSKTFNAPVCVEFTARPSSSMFGKSIALRMGNETQYVPLTVRGFTDYRVAFTSARKADRLEFIFPTGLPRLKDFDTSTTDARRLGLALVDLRIFSGNCSLNTAEVRKTP